MTQTAAITGICTGDVAARLICLLNTIRLARRFDVPARVLWAGGGDAPAFGDLLAKGPSGVTVAQDAGGDEPPAGENLTLLAARVNEAQLAQRFREGACFVLKDAYDLLVLMGEDAAAARAEAAGIAAELTLAPEIHAALTEAERRIEAWGGGEMSEASALWLGRDAESFYLPDEFCLQWAARQPGAVLLFSDHQKRSGHLPATDPGIVTADDLAPLRDLSPAARQTVQILLMARCARVAAGSSSPVARAAALFGHRRFCPLPDNLTEDETRQALRAHFDRVVERPGSFPDPAQLIRAVELASGHAVNSGQAGRLMRALDRGPLLRRRASLRHVLAECALADGDEVLARAEARRGLAETVLPEPARRQCRHLLDLMDGQSNPDDPASQDAFLLPLFTERALPSPSRDQLARLHIGRDGPVTDALMMPVDFSDLLRNGGDDPNGPPPLWCYLTDWEELLRDEGARRPLRETPSLHQKLALVRLDLSPIEAALQDQKPPPFRNDLQSARMLGLAGAILSLHGRLARALRLLKWLDRHWPDDPLTRKRLADTLYRAGKSDEAAEWLAGALSLRSGNPLLHLSQARRAAAEGRAAEAMDALERAEALWPGRGIVAFQAEQVRRSLAAD